MRSPSHLVFMTLVSCIGLAASSTAFAESAERYGSVNAASVYRITRLELDGAHEKRMASRVDERLAMSLAGPSSMECSHNAETGYETCTVRTQSATSPSAPAALAQN